MNDIYNNIDDYNPNRNPKILIVLDDIISDINTNKKFQFIVKESLIRCRKLNIPHKVIFFYSTRRQIKLYTLPDNEDP